MIDIYGLFLSANAVRPHTYPHKNCSGRRGKEWLVVKPPKDSFPTLLHHVVFRVDKSMGTRCRRKVSITSSQCGFVPHAPTQKLLGEKREGVVGCQPIESRAFLLLPIMLIFAWPTLWGTRCRAIPFFSNPPHAFTRTHPHRRIWKYF